MKIIKPFKLFIYDSCKGIPPELAMALYGVKPRIVGITYDKQFMVDKFGESNILIIYIWKWLLIKKWTTYEDLQEKGRLS